MTTTDHAAEAEKRPPMDAERIAAIRERLAAATPRPWEATTGRGGVHSGGYRARGLRAVQRHFELEWIAHYVEPHDAEFIAHAPTDIEDLLAEVERLRADVPLTLVSAGRHTRGGFGLTFGAGTVAAQDVLTLIADAMRAWFTDNGGINYVEATLRDRDGREWVMTVAPCGKPTPHQLRQRAEAGLELLTAERDALAAALAEQTARADHEDRCAVTAQRTADRLAATVMRVRGLHRESRGAMSALYPMPICECGQDYPCPTVRALDGEVA